MIKKENKLIQITLDPEYLSLLNSLAERFHCSKTDIVKQALKYFGSSKNHHYQVKLNQHETKETKNSEMTQEDIDEWNRIIAELESYHTQE